jgi:hypothetical protein
VVKGTSPNISNLFFYKKNSKRHLNYLFISQIKREYHKMVSFIHILPSLFKWIKPWDDLKILVMLVHSIERSLTAPLTTSTWVKKFKKPACPFQHILNIFLTFFIRGSGISKMALQLCETVISS